MQWNWSDLIESSENNLDIAQMRIAELMATVERTMVEKDAAADACRRVDVTLEHLGRTALQIVGEILAALAPQPVGQAIGLNGMGDENEIICSYCSTLFRYAPALAPHQSRPAECALRDAAA